MTIYREEIFGPVLSIIPFDTEEEAVRMANDTVYGLTNYIQTTDKDRQRRVARRLVGDGGMQRQGVRQGLALWRHEAIGQWPRGGPWGIHEFLEVKAVSDWD
jgi:aldehyde dehydrogenase (NAD+)